MRLLTTEVGGGTMKVIMMLKDTGSDYYTVFDAEFASLGDLSNYDPTHRHIAVTTANGFMSMADFRVQLQLLRQNGQEWGPWFVEKFCATCYSTRCNEVIGNARRTLLWHKPRKTFTGVCRD